MRMDSADMTRALMAIGASGAESNGGDNVSHSNTSILTQKVNSSSITVLFSLAVDRCGPDAISAGGEGQDLHAVIRVLLQAVEDRLAGRRDLGVLCVLVVPRVGRSVDDLKLTFKDPAAKGVYAVLFDSRLY